MNTIHPNNRRCPLCPDDPDQDDLRHQAEEYQNELREADQYPAEGPNVWKYSVTTATGKEIKKNLLSPMKT